MALVRRAVDPCEEYELPIATWHQARENLGLIGVAFRKPSIPAQMRHTTKRAFRQTQRSHDVLNNSQ
ncbi:hypothetical protein [Roseobacter sp.]|uniref:hypothetical protein n=1 Tax=Roseobacter sp. TaxID=1907202 RepID=UPI00385AD57C